MDVKDFWTRALTLLDFKEKLDINILDNVVEILHLNTGDQQKMAQDILTRFYEDENAWKKTDAIIKLSKYKATKYFGLQILENLVRNRWRTLPRNQCEDIKQFIVNLIIKTSMDQKSLDQEKAYLNKLNIILVQILKQEWPTNWPTFITDIVGASKKNESLCQNNLTILKFFTEDVLNVWRSEAETKNLKDTMCNEFSQIFLLCDFVLQYSVNIPLIHAALETLLEFLNWTPLSYIFDKQLINQLIEKCLVTPYIRNLSIQCLTKIVTLWFENDKKRIPTFYSQIVAQLEKTLPLSSNIEELYAYGDHEEQKFIQNLSLFLSTILQNHVELFQIYPQLNDTFLIALEYLLLISEIEEIEIFKVCLEYWHCLTAYLYQKRPLSNDPLGLFQDEFPIYVLWIEIYQEILSKLRCLIIGRMAKPEEVFVVENEQGEIVREFMRDTDSIQLYKSMKETLLCLTLLDYADTERIMTEKLHNQVSGTEWSTKKLNSLCWAIGSINDYIGKEDESRLLSTVLKNLMDFYEKNLKKDKKAIIAFNIMYIVGQYPLFFRNEQIFFEPVVNKLFEFMHETNHCVQVMACDTFIKIAQKCPVQFLTNQFRKPLGSFLDEILMNINTITCDLQPQQIYKCYESICYMIHSMRNPKMQKVAIEEVMKIPNKIWNDIDQIFNFEETLKEYEILQLRNVVKFNFRACKILGFRYIFQLSKIFQDMLKVYILISKKIYEEIPQVDQTMTRTNKMITIRRVILKTISLWITYTENDKEVLDDYIPDLLNSILREYQSAPEPARDPEVLLTIATIVNTLKDKIKSEVPNIFEHIFLKTISMIKKDFPEHRIFFYLLIKAVVNYCFQALLIIPAQAFEMVVDSVLWAVNSTLKNESDIGLDILYHLLENIGKKQENSQLFYQTFFKNILEQVFQLVIRASQHADLMGESKILLHMITLIKAKKIKKPLNAVLKTPNVQYIKQIMGDLLRRAFPDMENKHLNYIVNGLFKIEKDSNEFAQYLKKYLPNFQMEQSEDSSLILSLPNEILRKIFMNLSFEDNLTVQSVCSKFRSIARDRELWKIVNMRNISSSYLIEFLKSLPNCVEKLKCHISLNNLKDINLIEVFKLLHKSCTFLKVLIIENMEFKEQTHNEHIIDLQNAALPELDTLSLRNVKINSYKVLKYAAIIVPNLRILDLSSSQPSNLKILPQNMFKKLNNLEELFLVGWKFESTDVFTFLKHPKKLKVLDLESTNITDTQVVSLRRQCRFIRELFVAFSDIKNIYEGEENEDIFPNLLQICLINTPVTPNDIENLLNVCFVQQVHITSDNIHNDWYNGLCEAMKNKIVLHNEQSSVCHHFLLKHATH